MRFRTTILQSGKTACGIQVPPDVVAGLPNRRASVRVTINGYTYRSSIAVMVGVFMVGVSAGNRAASGATAGDVVDVDIEFDTAPRELTVSADLSAALDREPEARRSFDGLSYSNRQRHVLGVEGAKIAETRVRRIAKSVEMLRDRRT